MNTSSSLSKVLRDIIDLIELQIQLLSVDAQQAKQSCGRAILCGLVAAALLVPMITVWLLGFGFLLAEFTELTTGASVLIVAAIVTVLMGILGMVAIKAVRRASASMNESKSELVENVKWLKATLVNPSTAPRNRIRSESFEFPPYKSSVSSSVRGDQGWHAGVAEDHRASR